MRQFIKAADKIDGFQILPATVFIGQPVAGLARIIAIQHGCDRVHPQPVDVKFLQPEQRVGEQKFAHLIAPEIENQRAPIAMLALARIFVLEQRGPSKRYSPCASRGKCAGHPVEDHPDPGLVARVHEESKIVRRAEARRRREYPVT